MTRAAWEAVDERLWEWGRYFRDRGRFETCGSAEKYFRAQSEDFAAEGWGEMEKAVPVRGTRPGHVLEAIRTNEVIMRLAPAQKWGLTYHFCYAGLPRFVILRCLKKWTKRRLTWKQYLEQIDLGRMRVWAAFDTGPRLMLETRLSSIVEPAPEPRVLPQREGLVYSEAA